MVLLLMGVGETRTCYPLSVGLRNMASTGHAENPNSTIRTEIIRLRLEGLTHYCHGHRDFWLNRFTLGAADAYQA